MPEGKGIRAAIKRRFSMKEKNGMSRFSMRVALQRPSLPSEGHGEGAGNKFS